MGKQRYFIELAYDGSNYHGWQTQPNADTVQERLTEALNTILRDEVKLIGAGRTDTGVHASMMVAHFDAASMIEDESYFIHQLNGFIPPDIAIYSIKKVKEDAHARFDAISRTYVYKLHFRKNPFLLNRSYQVNRKLDIDTMNKASEELFNFNDFSSFSKLHSDTKTNNCSISRAEWIEEGEGAYFIIQANRFLRNMVRAISGTMLEVGLERLAVVDFKKIIEAKDRSAAGFSVPACGLYLTEITYPKDIYE